MTTPPEGSAPPNDATESADSALTDAAVDTDSPDTGNLGKPSLRHRLGTWWHKHLQRYSFGGFVVGLLFLWSASTPSLLPRGWFFQGVVSGGAAAIGYGVGAFLTWLARFMVSRDRPWPRPSRPWWIGAAIIGVAGTAFTLYWYARWQDEIRDMMGVDHLTWTAYPLIVVVALIVFVIFMSIGQAWATLLKWLVRQINRIAPPRISATIGVTLVLILTIFIVNGVFANYAMKGLNATFAAANEENKPNTPPPTSNLRSGGPESLVSWESLGREGRVFVSHGPTVQQLTEFNDGAPAMEPIRAYAGLDSADDIRDAADLAVAELERTNAFSRKLIAIAGTTGSGWMNKAMVDSLEYMYNGDVATVGIQYSYLPSWISFLVDSERARQAGIAIFEAVSEKVRAIPEAQRPKLVIFGESLGSFSGEAPFGSIPTIAARTDGALFSGPTFNNQLWLDTTNARDAGSPEVKPIFDDGKTVRFIADEQDLSRPDAPWPPNRVVYLQHASDPITWWNPDLLLSKPDWLKEPRGSDVLDATRWLPIVTFLQVSADMAVAVNVPDGHGHHYLHAVPYAWAQILQPPGWTPEKTEKLEPLLSRD
ncbi:alpha/beta hydrolase [Gordonia sp. (in: high G+C Gram-positive bacteria)]|uniref:alpha/beta hydrolase n=1 Tax=Gordonia sp. (in: high G+C Gram-positive bacteria) TaxID=84139 RepID=UPI003C72D8A0